MGHIVFGKEGEKLALEYLQRLNYTIIERNYRSGRMEIDVIAVNDKEVIFVEVKTRTADIWCMPEKSVTLQKQKNIIKTAHVYIVKNQINLDARFDIVSIIKNSKTLSVNHIPYAFYPRMRGDVLF